MKNFKGTKGKWKIIDAEDGVFIFSENNLLAEIEGYNNQIMFNAKLISKAPEMLERLQRIVNAQYGKGSLSALNSEIAEAKKLIEQATEL